MINYPSLEFNEQRSVISGDRDQDFNLSTNMAKIEFFNQKYEKKIMNFDVAKKMTTFNTRSKSQPNARLTKQQLFVYRKLKWDQK